MKIDNIKILILIFIAGCVMTGCSSLETEKQTSRSADTEVTYEEEQESPAAFVPELEVSFGTDGTPFTMHLYDNDTARAISRYVGTNDWNLPIYHYDDYENYEVMQFYDIPSRYEIPSSPEKITSQKAGEVFYSEPNRIVLFYHDANVTGEYTRLGTFDASDDFVSAVENNPVVEGWSNKIVSIRPVD